MDEAESDRVLRGQGFQGIRRGRLRRHGELAFDLRRKTTQPAHSSSARSFDAGRVGHCGIAALYFIEFADEEERAWKVSSCRHIPGALVSFDNLAFGAGGLVELCQGQVDQGDLGLWHPCRRTWLPRRRYTLLRLSRSGSISSVSTTSKSRWVEPWRAQRGCFIILEQRSTNDGIRLRGYWRRGNGAETSPLDAPSTRRQCHEVHYCRAGMISSTGNPRQFVQSGAPDGHFADIWLYVRTGNGAVPQQSASAHLKAWICLHWEAHKFRFEAISGLPLFLSVCAGLALFRR